MVKYMSMPQNQLTLGSTVITGKLSSATVPRLENGFDTATLDLPDALSDLYPSTVTVGTAFQLDVKDANEAAYTTISKGIVRFPILPQGNKEIIQLKCDGSGYGLGDTVCAQEYGNQSRNPTLDTLLEILTDATNGLIPKWVNKILGSATDSGFSYTTTAVDTITGAVPYLYYPYKPCNKSIDDLIDLVTAIKAGTAGPHFIVTTDDVLHVKLIDASQASWTKYYGGATNTAGQATLVQGIDFTDSNFEPIGPESNYIIYNGVWRRPSSGDLWTEGVAADWGHNGTTLVTDESGAGLFIVGAQSLKTVPDGGGCETYWPSTKDALWNFKTFKEFEKPTLSFHIRSSGRGLLLPWWQIRLVDTDGDQLLADYSGSLPADDVWQHIELPVGPFFKENHTANSWTLETGSFDWETVDYLQFESADSGGTVYYDGLHFGGAQITRIAKNSTNITANKLKVKVVTDNIGKDDTLACGTVGTTDQGFMAQMAYAELLRLQTSSIVGTVTVSMLKDALPGQWFHIHAKKKADGTFNIDKDMRATKVTHNISSSGYFTTLELTDDLTNSHPRPRYEDRNKVSAATRPEYQDRQASSIKAGDIDIRVTPLEEDYPT
jgi:hypothetical protein